MLFEVYFWAMFWLYSKPFDAGEQVLNSGQQVDSNLLRIFVKSHLFNLLPFIPHTVEENLPVSIRSNVFDGESVWS